MNRQRNNKKDGNKIRQRKAERRRRIKKENYESSVIFLIVKKFRIFDNMVKYSFSSVNRCENTLGSQEYFLVLH